MVIMGLTIPYLLHMPICRLPDSHQTQVVHPQGRRRKFLFHCDRALFLLMPSSSRSFDLSAGEEPAKGVSTKRTPDFLIELRYVFFFQQSYEKKMTALLRASCLWLSALQRTSSFSLKGSSDKQAALVPFFAPYIRFKAQIYTEAEQCLEGKYLERLGHLSVPFRVITGPTPTLTKPKRALPCYFGGSWVTEQRTRTEGP